ncbi:hypothetical protein [Leptodesmis sp.]|uniref:hypothetical protein n=1 Tax=Leptodesmis sp. TaxID=3100501 RepID=UPI00405358A6
MPLLDVPDLAVVLELVADLFRAAVLLDVCDGRPLDACFTVAPVSALVLAAVVVLWPREGLLVESAVGLVLEGEVFPGFDRGDFAD